MRNSTKLKKVLQYFDVEIKLYNGTFELYLYNKETEKTCIIEDRAWWMAIQKSFTILNNHLKLTNHAKQ